jgi:hypothetical protein
MKEPATNKAYASVLTLVLALIVVFLVSPSQYILLAAFLLGLLCLLFPALTLIVHYGWTKLGKWIGVVTGSILLTIVFFLVVFPLGIVIRQLGKSSVMLTRNKTSFFKTRNHSYRKEDMENLW